jgi:hypothetical protein
MEIADEIPTAPNGRGNDEAGPAEHGKPDDHPPPLPEAISPPHPFFEALAGWRGTVRSGPVPLVLLWHE